MYPENPEEIAGENQYSPELPLRSKDHEGDTDMAEENKYNGYQVD